MSSVVSLYDYSIGTENTLDNISTRTLFDGSTLNLERSISLPREAVQSNLSLISGSECYDYLDDAEDMQHCNSEQLICGRRALISSRPSTPLSQRARAIEKDITGVVSPLSLGKLDSKPMTLQEKMSLLNRSQIYSKMNTKGGTLPIVEFNNYSTSSLQNTDLNRQRIKRNLEQHQLIPLSRTQDNARDIESDDNISIASIISSRN
ncbi:hypothetical protein Kpol_411p7 [Vanderwaltozyma polyspora DSM 70294]|uniref:Uncharacterized protein n=1 Tax=Vanderwaltozyma polyspora (strain ATCC 22028 / DSM 70294 / BCRC 21397 / CBS 2163 / NBRC 10782 / NRRL Y-8283 / UCD 57-17) TaxID=436907 RepID=A7TRP0_VANPO|nr:uncharacterized protein Kpol_411p7 [Vanderwaltozyma polyspora DSM 70294]EDO15062.1 hypothetical protein Kpol_411p7 [Vanderwaltozyma polyspora DSM 70294]